MNSWWAIRILLIGFVVIYTLGRIFPLTQPDFLELNHERSQKAKANLGDIEIALVWGDMENADNGRKFFHGAKVFADHINREEGGLLGRKLVIHTHLTEDTKGLARTLTNNTNIRAVLGYYFSKNAIPASITYNNGGMLFISPFATNKKLTSHNYHLTFSMIPDDQKVSIAALNYCRSKGYQDIGLVYVRSLYGASLYSGILEHSQGFRVHASMYPTANYDFTRLTYQLKEKNCDVIIIGDTFPRGGELIETFRQQGLEQPIICLEGMDNLGGLISIEGNQGEGTIVVSPFPGLEHLDKSRVAKHKYQRVLEQHIDDRFSADGMSAVMTYAQAVAKAESSDPITVASVLKFNGPWFTLTDPEFSFGRNGECHSMDLFIKILKDQAFQLTHIHQVQKDAPPRIVPIGHH